MKEVFSLATPVKYKVMDKFYSNCHQCNGEINYLRHHDAGGLIFDFVALAPAH